MKKKLTALGLVMAAVLSLFAGMTLSYFTDEDEVNNTFTVGNVAIDVYETDEDGTSFTDVGRTYENIVPGVAYEKDPTIDNIGDNDAYVRMVVTVSKDLHDTLGAMGYTLDDIFVKALDYVENPDGTISSEGTWPWSYDEFIEDAGDNAVAYIYNYDGVLVPGATATLFESFQLPEDLTQEDLSTLLADDMDKEFKIDVVGQAIQADGFDTAEEAFAALDRELYA